MIIYPPFIADTIPAFTTDKIVIPFSQNPAVSIEEVNSFKLIIQDYLSSNFIAFSTTAANNTHLIYNADTKSGEVIFTDFIDNTTKEKWAPTAKQYYKFQMSYSDDDAYNAYSSASIGRCIGIAPTIKIETLTQGFSYQGKCTTPITEPVYSYRFILTMNNTIIQDTGEILNNVDNDKISNNIRTTENNFKIKYEIKGTVTLKYSIITINGYKASASVNIDTNIIDGDEDLGFELNISQDDKAKNNGYVQINLKTISSSNIKTTPKTLNLGSFTLIIKFKEVFGRERVIIFGKFFYCFFIVVDNLTFR